MKLWIVGKFVDSSILGTVWLFEGVFDNEDSAVSICTSEYHFVGPCELNQPIVKDEIWPGAYYPLREGKPNG